MAKLGPLTPLPAFFLVTSTGRHHRVKRASRNAHPGGTIKDSWIMILYWCGNTSLGDRGSFSDNRPYDSRRCDRCETAYDRNRRAQRRVDPARPIRGAGVRAGWFDL